MVVHGAQLHALLCSFSVRLSATPLGAIRWVPGVRVPFSLHVQESQHECGKLRGPAHGGRLGARYLMVGAAAGSTEPKLSHAWALSISVSRASAVAAGEG